MNKISSPSKIFTIIKHEYISKIKTKAFIIGTLLGPLIMLAFIVVPLLVTMLSMNSNERKIAILDNTSKIGDKIVKTDMSKYFLTDKNEDILKKQVLSENIDGYLVIPENVIKSGKVTVYTRGGGGLAFLNKLETIVSEVVRNERLHQAGVDLSVIDMVEKGVEIQTQKITEKGTEKDFTEAYAVVGYIFGLVIYMLMFIYGTFVMRGVIEEKANRIVEVLASSAKPFEIMMGKVIGIGAVGLTQVLFWALLSMIILNFSGSLLQLFSSPENLIQQNIVGNQIQMNQVTQMSSKFEIPHLSPWLFVGFIFYFLSGYFLYATLFAAIGSAVDQESDAQQLQTPVSILIVIPILFIGYVISSPEAVLSVILSLFPFFSPMIMMVRIAASPVPMWQIVLSVVLMILAFLGSIWVAARIYRVGILMYGKKPSFKDIFKWFRLAK